MYLDKYGLIVQQSGDGGDSAQRMGMWWSAFAIRKRLCLPTFSSTPAPCGFDEVCKLLITQGGLIRNPAPGTSSPFWNDPTYTSRDQTDPIIIAAGFFLDTLEGMFTVLNALKPGLTFQNGDPAGPQDWNIFYRAYASPGMPLGDIQALGSATVLCSQTKSDPDNVGNDLNMILELSSSYLQEKIPLTRAALIYYLMNRPPNNGNTQLGEKDPVMGALMWYFRPAAGGNPECAEIWRDIITKLRSDLNCSI